MWTTKTGTEGSDKVVMGGGTDIKGNTVQEETSSLNGILTNVTKVTKDSGAVDIYVDKTWG